MTATGTGGGDSDYWSAGSRCSDRKQGAGGGRRRAAAAAMRGKWRARTMESAAMQFGAELARSHGLGVPRVGGNLATEGVCFGRANKLRVDFRNG
jgi:hypothetical protein